VIALAIALPALSAALLLSLGQRTNIWGPYLSISASTSAFVVGSLMKAPFKPKIKVKETMGLERDVQPDHSYSGHRWHDPASGDAFS